jgi:hypothetical protein
MTDDDEKTLAFSLYSHYSSLITHHSYSLLITNMYLLALNCGSSSIKGRLYRAASASAPLESLAQLAVSNIGAKGDTVRVQIRWSGDVSAKDVDEAGGEGGSAQRE